MDASEVRQVEDTLRELFLRNCADQVGAALVEIGWHDLVEAEPCLAPATLFRQKGLALSSSPLLSFAVAHVIDRDPLSFGVALPADPHGTDFVGSSRHKAWLFLPALGDHQAPGAWLTETVGDDLNLSPVSGIDPDYGLVRIRNPRPTEAMALGLTRSTALVAAVARAQAEELLGVSRGMLEVALTHVSQREQFGRSLGSFQAVKHQLARAHVALAGAQAVLQEAWLLDDDEIMTLAGLAAVRAAAELVRSASQQVCGAIGFTMEHRLHRFVRRSVLLASLWATQDRVLSVLGETLSRTRTLPRLSGVDIATELTFA